MSRNKVALFKAWKQRGLTTPGFGQIVASKSGQNLLLFNGILIENISSCDVEFFSGLDCLDVQVAQCMYQIIQGKDCTGIPPHLEKDLSEDLNQYWLFNKNVQTHWDLKKLPLSKFNPSSNWDIGGTIIESEMISIGPQEIQKGKPLYWAARTGGAKSKSPTKKGETPLIAAMEAYVASYLEKA